jgi:oligoribonuclease NrnB/cAMP/cGMP phosphodiesterase (DHH superfamily)
MLSSDYDRFDKEEEFNQLLDYDEIIMTDYSCKKEVVEKLLEKGKIVKILDHHKNEQTEKLNEIKHHNFEYVFDNEKSGALITYEYFRPSNVRVKKIFADVINYISTYDLFKTQSPDWEQAQNFNRVLYGCLSWGAEEIHKFDWIKDFWIDKINKSNEWHWTNFEQKKIDAAIASENKEYLHAMSTYREYTDSKNKRYAVAVADKKISIVALRILEEKPELDYLIMINNYTKKWDRISVRSHIGGTFNCNSLNECKGHDCAAGGEVDPKFALKLYKGLEKLTYKTGDMQ